MTPEQLARVDALFDAARGVSPEARAACLDEHCADAPEVRAEVESLLVHHDRSAGFLQPATASMAEDLSSLLPGDPMIDRRVGKCVIKRFVDAGGMGAVYKALHEPSGRTVALKMMLAAPSPTAARRFDNEIRILMRLRHPGIAEIIEAGTFDEDGEPVPFYAMEFVPNARPITEYAETKKLSRTDRIELFIEVCNAVAHANETGVIHRDLKPSNILVDTSGRPKVIDFGIARAADLDTTASIHMEGDDRAGTLQYMSPEQVTYRDPEDLNARSDVHSLGVILYQMVCGRLPYDLRAVKALEAQMDLVCREVPARPREVDRSVPRDLDTVIMKAMEKDRERRYASALELARDLDRFLRGEPIMARSPTLGYVLVLALRRHRTLTVGVAVGMLALIVVTVVSMVYADVARRERIRAERGFALGRQFAAQMLDVDAMIRDLPEALAAREFMIEQAARYLDGLREEAGDDPEIGLELARGYRKLADALAGIRAPTRNSVDDALAYCDRALSLLDTMPPGDRRAFELAFAWCTKGDLTHEMDWYTRAWKSADDLCQRTGALDECWLRAIVQMKLADLTADDPEAKKLLAGARETLEQLVDESPGDAKLARALRQIYGRLGGLQTDSEKAIELYDMYVDESRAAFEEHPDSSSAREYMLALADRLRYLFLLADHMGTWYRWRDLATGDSRTAVELARRLNWNGRDFRARLDMARVLTVRAEVLFHEDQDDAARECLAEAEEEYARLEDLSPGDRRIHAGVVWVSALREKYARESN